MAADAPSLAGRDWLGRPATRRVVAALEEARPGGVRFVGGCVRNALLGEAVGDIDLATQLTPDEVSGALLAAGIAVHPTGVAHGTLTAVADGEPFEVTTLRRDVSTDGRRATVAFTDDWAEDARRRDFHLNALYAAPDGEVFDPTGQGLADLAARRIRFIGDPAARIREDYLRVLRFFRFLAWYGAGAPDAEGLAACASLRHGLAQVSAERVAAELLKLLAARDPVAAVATMAATGVLATILPEAGEPGRLRRLVAIEAAGGLSPQPLLRLAALAPVTPAIVGGLARRLRFANDDRLRLRAALGEAGALRPRLPPAEARRLLYSWGAATYRDRVLLAWAAGGEAADDAGWRATLAHAAGWIAPHMPVDGEDALAAGAAPGPDVGRLLREVEAWWVAGDFSATREQALAELARRAGRPVA